MNTLPGRNAASKIHSRKASAISAGLTILLALFLSACGIVRLPAQSRPGAPGSGYGPGMMGGGYGYGPGGMMGPGHMSSMMRGYAYGLYAPTAEPIPAGTTPEPVDEEITVTASNFRFTPAEITVKPGEIVRFVVANTDAVPHNLVSPEAGIPYLALPAGTTQAEMWRAPDQTGTYAAVCTFHPGMNLYIVVKR